MIHRQSRHLLQPIANVAQAGLMLIVFVGLTGCSRMESRVNQQELARREWESVRADMKLQIARQQFRAGAAEEAARTAMEAIALDPARVESYVLLVQAQIEGGDLALAEQTLEWAAQRGLVSAALVYTKGVIQEHRKLYEEAIESYRRARTLDPTDRDHLIAEAECLVALDRPQEALALIEPQLSRFEYDGSLRALAGHLALLIGELDKAARWYEEAAIILPDDRIIAENYGLLLVRMRRYPDALAVLRGMVETAPEKVAKGSVLRALARCDLELGDPAAAREILRDYLTQHEGDFAAHLLMAEAALAGGDLPTAYRHADRASRIEPRNPEVWLVQAAVDFRGGDHPSAEVRLTQVLASNDRDVEANCLLGEVLTASGRNDSARHHFEVALAQDPTCAWAAVSLARLNAAASTTKNKGNTSQKPVSSEGVWR